MSGMLTLAAAIYTVASNGGLTLTGNVLSLGDSALSWVSKKLSIATTVGNSSIVTGLNVYNGGAGAGTGARISVGYGPADGNGVGMVGYYDGGGAGMDLVTGNSSTARMTLPSTDPSSGQVAILVQYHNGTSVTIQRVTLGDADSGGNGYKVLRVPN